MNGGAFVLDKGWAFRLMTVITLTAGTGFLMWLGRLRNAASATGSP